MNFIIFHNFHFFTSAPNSFPDKSGQGEREFYFIFFQERIVCLGEDLSKPGDEIEIHIIMQNSLNKVAKDYILSAFLKFIILKNIIPEIQNKRTKKFCLY